MAVACRTRGSYAGAERFAFCRRADSQKPTLRALSPMSSPRYGASQRGTDAFGGQAALAPLRQPLSACPQTEFSTRPATIVRVASSHPATCRSPAPPNLFHICYQSVRAQRALARPHSPVTMKSKKSRSLAEKRPVSEQRPVPIHLEGALKPGRAVQRSNRRPL